MFQNSLRNTVIGGRNTATIHKDIFNVSDTSREAMLLFFLIGLGVVVTSAVRELETSIAWKRSEVIAPML